MAPAFLFQLPLLTAAVAGTAPCETDADCSYNGVCTTPTGACSCLPQWQGPHCASLRLLPSPRSAGLQDADSPFSWDAARSYWGGSVLQGDDGRYHMWAAEIVQGCGIWTWMPNSQVGVA